MQNIHKIRKASVRHTIFLSYIIILLLTLSCQFIYYVFFSNTTAKNTQKMQITLLEQLEDDIRGKIEYSNVLRDTLSTSDLLLLARGYGGYSYTELFKDMDSAYIPEYYANVAIYFRRQDTVASPGSKLSAPIYFRYFCQLQQQDYEEFKEQYLMPTLVEKVGKVLKIKLEGEERTVLPYFNSFRIIPNMSPDVQFCFFIDLAQTLDLMRQIETDFQAEIFILDENDECILSTDTAATVDPNLLHELRQGKANFQFRGNGESFYGTQITNVDSQWKYVMITPRSVYYHEFIPFSIQWFFIFLVYLLGGLVIVYYFTRRSYRPVRELQELLEEHMGKKLLSSEGVNEFDRIKSEITKQFHVDQELVSTLEDQLPILQRDYIMALVKGVDMDYANASKRLQALGVALYSNEYITVLAEIDPHCDFFLEDGGNLETNHSLARLIVQNVGHELIDRNFLCFDLAIDQWQTLFVLNVRRDTLEEYPDEPVYTAIERLKELMRFTDSNYQLNVRIGVSMCHPGLDNLSRCMDESQKALEHCSFSNNPLEYYGNLQDVKNNYFYSIEMEYSLSNLLRTGRFEEGKKLLNHILDINMEIPSLEQSTILVLLHEISSTLLRTMNTIRLKRNMEPLDAEAAKEKLPQSASFDLARKEYETFIDEIEEISSRSAMGKAEKLVSDMADFINANIREDWLDRNSVANEFGITPQHLSMIFKKYKGENVKEYISKLRLQRAKKLLLETNLLTRDVAKEIGSNEIGLLRLFKKYEGCTPGEFRLKYSTCDAGPSK